MKAHIQDYTTFGSSMPGRNANSNAYRYSFNGKEKDAETDLQDYGMRIYNPGLGRFLSVDPISKKFPWYSTYQFAGDKPIWATDLDGLEENYANMPEAEPPPVEPGKPATWKWEDNDQFIHDHRVDDVKEHNGKIEGGGQIYWSVV